MYSTVHTVTTMGEVRHTGSHKAGAYCKEREMTESLDFRFSLDARTTDRRHSIKALGPKAYGTRSSIIHAQSAGSSGTVLYSD